MGRFVEAQSGMGVVRGWREEGMGNSGLARCTVLVWDDENSGND